MCHVFCSLSSRKDLENRLGDAISHSGNDANLADVLYDYTGIAKFCDDVCNVIYTTGNDER